MNLAEQMKNLGLRIAKPATYLCSRCRDSGWLERADQTVSPCPDCPAVEARKQRAVARAPKRSAGSGEGGRI